MQDLLTVYAIAMASEAKDIISDYKKIEDVPLIYKKDNKLVVITNIGKTNASFALTYVLSKYRVKEVINLGFVGAYGNFNIGDIVLVDEAKYHDFDLTLFGYEKGQVPHLPVSYSPSSKLYDKLTKNYKKVLLLTGDYFQTSNINDSFISDMEGTALFQVCHLMKVPILSVKVVSDLIGRKNHIDDYNDFESKGSSYIKKIYDLLEV